MSNGQLREDVKSAAYCKDVSLVNRMGGNLIELQDILNRIYVNAGIDEEYKLHSKERKYYIDYTHDETYKDELDNDDILRHRVIE